MEDGPLDAPDKQTAPSLWKAIGWWEVRRILFNLILIVSVQISVQLIRLLVPLDPGEDAWEPFAIFGLIFLLNVAYTFSWFWEIGQVRKPEKRWQIFKGMVYASLALIFLSPVVNFIRLIASWISG